MLTTQTASAARPKLSTFLVFAFIFAVTYAILSNFMFDDEPSNHTIETVTVPVECVNNGIGCPVNFDRDIIAPAPNAGGYDSGAADGSNTPGASTCDSKYCTFTRTVRS